MNKEIGLVLEGGGFRGCYTAGALKWLYDHNLMMSYTVGISAANAYGFLYASEKIDELHEVAVTAVKDPGFLGVRSIFREQQIVGFNMFREKYIYPYYQEALAYLRSTDREVEVGVYNMDKEQLEYHGKADLDDQGELIKASCVLPLSGKKTFVNGAYYMDGGVDTMVSIRRSMETGHTKNLIIVTKDKNYVRKPNGFLLSGLISIVYHKNKKMLKLLDGRVDRYYEEMNTIYQLEKEGKAILIRPSKDCGVKRFSGSLEQLEEMYRLGWQDMEDRKEELLEFLK